MKKISMIVLTLMIACGAFIGCDKSDDETDTETDANTRRSCEITIEDSGYTYTYCYNEILIYANIENDCSKENGTIKSKECYTAYTCFIQGDDSHYPAYVTSDAPFFDQDFCESSNYFGGVWLSK